MNVVVKRQYRLLFLLVSALVWFGILYRGAISGAIEQGISVITYPAYAIQTHIVHPYKVWLFERRTHQELKQELVRIEEENRSLRSTLVECNASQRYADDIKDLQDFKQQFQIEQALCAQIIERLADAREHTITMDKGLYHGIKRDMVAVYKNCLVGKVIEVFPYYCKVVLVTDATCKVAASCATTKATGIVAGTNTKDQLLLQRVDHLATITIGDQVFSSGEGLIFPQGFLLGMVSGVTTSGLYHEAQVTPCIDVNAINYCLLIEKGNYRNQPAPISEINKDSEVGNRE